MGFFYKAGGGAGVSVHEESTYDALATASKTLPHEQLMLDTSTGFYYKNWKTGGPGIPVPVRYFDSVTGYATNSGSVRSNAYFTLEDAEADVVSATNGEDWTVFEGSGTSVSKTADNPFIIRAPGTNASCGLRFFASSANTKTLNIVKISSITGSVKTTGMGNIVLSNGTNGATTYFHYFNFNAVSNNTVKATNQTGSVLSEGDNFALVTPEWIIYTADSTNADSGFSCQSTKNTAIGMAERSTASTASASNQTILFLVNADTTTFELQIPEAHSLVW